MSSFAKPRARAASGGPTDTDAARVELQRAYLLLGFGDVEGARQACAEAQRLAPSHPLPFAVAGGIEIAAGRVPAALQALRKVTRKWPDAPCGHVYFSEACFFAGRRRQGLRALERAGELDADSVWADQIEQMRELWGPEPDFELPELVVLD